MEPLLVVGIDPGSTLLGFSVISVDLETGKRTLIFSKTLDASKVIKTDSTFAIIRNKRDARLTFLAQEISTLLDLYCPHIVAAESAFARRFRISAFEALIETMAVIRATVWQHSHVIKIYKIDPVTIKNHVGVSHIKTDKVDVENAVMKLYKSTAKCNTENLGPDAYDSIAVAHAAIDKLVDNIEIVSTRKKSRRKPKGSSNNVKKRRRRTHKIKGK